MTTYHGKCHCGELEWDVLVQPDQANHILCHCNTCQTLSGGTYTLNQIVPLDAFKVTKGEDKVKKYTYYGDSGKAVNCYYCSNCTTSPYHQQEILEGKIILRTGLLDGPRETFQPSAEIYGKDRHSWEKEVATTFDAMPS
ncbi:Mss4-like protein [Lineolata rhizophorae]|uniref:Mss4-like protein n=1 Tax=Lineolata rhizophorae TaxID=578093 RepID=A0A6A6P343_9PEZI|nr:Mss4-like protein [Lineolata rhizophorae]